MYLRYGNHLHALDEAAIAIAKTALLNDAKIPYGTRHVWKVTGFLQADTAAALTTAIRQLEAAYAVHGQNAWLLMNDGSRSAHELISAASVGGVIVTEPPSFPVGDGAEYSTFRSYSLTLEAEFGAELSGNRASILEWDETLAFSGGGPRYAMFELRSGPPQRQLVSQQTVFRASQRGRAVGYINWPSMPAPIWPAAEDRTQRQTTFGSPDTKGFGVFRQQTNFPIAWSYEFQSVAPLDGQPTQRPF